MKTTLYLIRHGETNFNREKRFQGQIDAELSPEGLKQAEKLRGKMKNIHVDAIYCSPLQRARKTAEIAFPEKELIIFDELKERSYGNAEGMLRKDFDKEFPHLIEDYEKRWHLDVEGVELFDDLKQRAVQVIEDIAKKEKGKSIAIVAHGGLLRAFLMKITGKPDEKHRDYRFGNTSLTIMEYENGEFNLKSFNDISHLD